MAQGTDDVPAFRLADGRSAEIPPGSMLLLVDFQVGFIAGRMDEGVIGRTLRTVDRLAPVLGHRVASRFVNAADAPCTRLLRYDGVMEPPDTDLVDGVEERVDEVITKSTYALGALLDPVIARHAPPALVIAGVDTHACVCHEAFDAFDRCVRPVVLADLCASGDGKTANDCALQVLRASVGEHNVFFGH